jgi:hypothetical protein
MKNYFTIFLLVVICTNPTFCQEIIEGSIEIKGDQHKSKLVIKPNNEDNTIDIFARKNHNIHG